MKDSWESSVVPLQTLPAGQIAGSACVGGLLVGRILVYCTGRHPP